MYSARRPLILDTLIFNEPDIFCCPPPILNCPLPYLSFTPAYPHPLAPLGILTTFPPPILTPFLFCQLLLLPSSPPLLLLHPHPPSSSSYPRPLAPSPVVCVSSWAPLLALGSIHMHLHMFLTGLSQRLHHLPPGWLSKAGASPTRTQG